MSSIRFRPKYTVLPQSPEIKKSLFQFRVGKKQICCQSTAVEILYKIFDGGTPRSGGPKILDGGTPGAGGPNNYNGGTPGGGTI